MKETTWENVGQHFTQNGVLIEKGLKIRNYNYDDDIVVRPVPYGNPAEPQWFYTQRGMFDGSRMVAL